MHSRFDFAGRPASNMPRFEPFQRRNAGAIGVPGGGSLVKALRLPWLPLYLLAVCAYQPVLGRQAFIAALAMAVMTISAEVLTKRLTTTWASKKCRRAKPQASSTYWI